MSNRKLSDNAAAIMVAVLMLLTAYGNAWVMLAVAGLLLVGLFVLFRDNAVRQGALPAVAAAVVALVIALEMILFLRRQRLTR
jgi:uncharacterized membrane protein YgaE (UPF0421/DUF939 family)